MINLLVFAHVPPPLHGQSAMVATLVDGLRGDDRIRIHHIDARLSRDDRDVGRWRPGKLVALLGYCMQALGRRARVGDCALYYVPAPGKRGALYRDLLVLALCRPWFTGVVLHWHAVGLGAWVLNEATAIERWLARRLLGGVDLAIVLAPELKADAAVFQPRAMAVVPNGVPDPGPPPPRPPGTGPFRIIFLGTCSRAKGLFTTVEAVALAERTRPGGFALTVAGGFANAAEEREFAARVAALPAGLVEWIGFVGEPRKTDLFRAGDALCFPTTYAHEGQPLAVIEALAHDVPVITTRWRAIPGMLPREHVWFVESGDAAGLARTLAVAADAARPGGALRRHYLAHFTPERHLAALKAALLGLARTPGMECVDKRAPGP